MHSVRRRFRFGSAALLVGLAFTCAAVLPGQAVLPDSQPLHGLRLELKRTDAQQSSLEELLQDQRTPGSGAYHHWLTPKQFAERFAPDASVQAAALLWVQRQGFQAAQISANGMRVQFDGTVAQIRQTFAMQLRATAAGSGKAVATSALSLTAHTLPAGSRLGALEVNPSGGVSDLASALDANTAAAVVSSGPASSSPEAVADWQELLAEAAAQGITVLQAGGTGADSAVASAAVLQPVVGESTADTALATAQSRPAWQVAAGLPSSGSRGTPDAVVDVNALATALNGFTTQHGRIGPLAPLLYSMASGHGIFSRDGTTEQDALWTAADGLGTLNIAALLQALATGTTLPNVALAVSSTTLTHGQALTLTQTVTGGSGTPTGTVTAALKGRSGTTVMLGPATLNASGVATLSTSTLAGDVYDISGSYSGDGTYANTTSNTVTSTVLPENAVLTASAPATAVGGTIPVTVTATSSSGVGVPSGSVTVTAYGVSTTPATYSAALPSSTSSTSSAVVSVPATAVGSYTFQANCTASASFACNKPKSFDVTVSQATPTVALTSTPQAATANSATQKYSLAVTVTAPSGSTATPTGTVTITNNGAQVGTVTLSNGAGTYTASLSGTGNTLVASYSGDTNFAAASSSAVTVNGALISTTTTLSGSPISLGFGSTASLTASVTPASYVASGSPTGTITFTSNLQGVVGTATLGNGYVTYSLNTLKVGAHSITASYSGDSNYAASTSPAMTITVAAGKLATTTTLSILPLQPLAAQMTTLTATVTPNTSGLGVVCTGQVTFFSNGIYLGNGSLSGGAVSVQVSLPSATDSVTASYAGDNACYGSTSSATVVSPAKIASTISLQSSAAYANAGQTIQLTATVSPADSTQIGTPTGVVTFYALRGGLVTPIGTAVLTATGLNSAIAVLGVNGTSAGQQSFSAMYSGDTNFLASTSTTLLANFGDFALAVNPSSLTIARGSTGTALATLTVANGFTGTVVLSCTPPASSLITCAFVPNTLVGGGTATLTVKTMLTSAQLRSSAVDRRFVACVGLLGALLVPFAWRRRSLAPVLLACVCVLCAGGCSLTTVDSTNNLNSGSGTSPTSGSGGSTTTGTPLGTQLLTLTAASADGTLQHSYSYSVTVQ